VIRTLARNRVALVGTIAFALLVLACLVVPTVFGHDPYAVDFEQKQEGPSFAHPLGTDFFAISPSASRSAAGRRCSSHSPRPCS